MAKNTIGEPVASGVYFYELQADNLSFLRKMVIPQIVSNDFLYFLTVRCSYFRILNPLNPLIRGTLKGYFYILNPLNPLYQGDFKMGAYSFHRWISFVSMPNWSKIFVTTKFSRSSTSFGK